VILEPVVGNAGFITPEPGFLEGIRELTKDNAVEILFNAGVQDPSLAILPWIEREFTRRAMQKTGDNQVRAAKLLGITRATLRKRLDRNSAISNEVD